MPITVGNSSGNLKRKYVQKYDTKLDPDVEANYNKQYSPQSSRDYDMRGWYKENAQSLAKPHQGHYTDKFKKPNHPTFSNESKYATKENPGGTWLKDDFLPADNQVNTSLKVKRLKSYWQRAEPKGAQLLLPKGK